MEYPPPSFFCRSWMQWLPKLGEDDKDCQDFGDRSETSRRFVLCDGVSNSSLPAVWARLLAQYLCAHETLVLADKTLEIALRDPREAWVKLSQQKSKAAWWLAGPKAIGATTFLSVSLIPDPLVPSSLLWDCQAAGDTCLFLWRQGEQGWHLHATFPLCEEADFHRSPSCLFTSEEAQAARHPGLSSFQAKALEGDLLFLATDAFSKWLLSSAAPEDSWRICMGWLADRSVFRAYVDHEREAGRMDDDDITLLAVELVRIHDGLLHPSFPRREPPSPFAPSEPLPPLPAHPSEPEAFDGPASTEELEAFDGPAPTDEPEASDASGLPTEVQTEIPAAPVESGLREAPTLVAKPSRARNLPTAKTPSPPKTPPAPPSQPPLPFSPPLTFDEATLSEEEASSRLSKKKVCEDFFFGGLLLGLLLGLSLSDTPK